MPVQVHIPFLLFFFCRPWSGFDCFCPSWDMFALLVGNPQRPSHDYKALF